MAEALAKPRVSVSDYLAFEREAEQRHEFIDGEIVDMSGGTFTHSVISLNLGAELRAALRERPCTVCSPDLRVRPLRTRFRYAFIHTYKPVLDDEPFRAFDTTADYRKWCEENLPDWLGYGRL